MNYIFDMGNVLITYEPFKVVDRYAAKADAKALLYAIFEDGDWSKKDTGIYSPEEYIQVLKNKIPEAKLQCALDIYEHWHECLEPIDGAYEYVKKLKVQRNPRSLLSTATEDFCAHP